MSSSIGGSLSSVPNGRSIDFEIAELRKVPFQDSLYLWVSGKLPTTGFDVKLAPRVYHNRPDYWGIEVMSIMLPTPANDSGEFNEALNFVSSIPLSGVTGNRGVTVIGANQLKRIDISSE